METMKKIIDDKAYFEIEDSQDFWETIIYLNYTEEYTKEGLLIEVENNNNYFIVKDYIQVTYYDNESCMIWIFDAEYYECFDRHLVHNLIEMGYLYNDFINNKEGRF